MIGVMNVKKIRILYIGNQIDVSANGADIVNKRNISLLRSLDPHMTIFKLGGYGFLDKLNFSISSDLIHRVETELQTNNYTHVFISQSLLGRAASYIKKKFPEVRLITFCHNIEIDYAKSYLNTSGLKALPFYIMTKYWERKCIKNSDLIITLNSRDSKRLKDVYEAESALELPTSFNDVYDEEKAKFYLNRFDSLIDYLFVGVAFFPNISGVQWLIDNVMPQVKGHLYVVGKGMDEIHFKNLNNRIHVYGFVEDLSDFYYRAKVIVSPIFIGAGMKTKTAEALMFGKTIIGTTEAFEGYELNHDCMKLANTTNEFIQHLNDADNNKYDVINQQSRQLFAKNYNTNAIYVKLKGLLAGTI